MPSFTFIAAARALQWQEVMPVFCDVAPGTHNTDPEQVVWLVTPRTTGSVGVHLWSEPCDHVALADIARRRGLHLMFDSCHAFGCAAATRTVGGLGRAEVFSFHATKFLNAGQGGGAAGDGPLHLLDARHGRAAMLPEAMGAYRVHPGGVWSRRTDADRLRGTAGVLTAATRDSAGGDRRAFARGVAVHRRALRQALGGGGHPAEAAREVAGVLRSPGALLDLPGVALVALRSKLGRLRRHLTPRERAAS